MQQLIVTHCYLITLVTLVVLVIMAGMKEKVRRHSTNGNNFHTGHIHEVEVEARVGSPSVSDV